MHEVLIKLQELTLVANPPCAGAASVREAGGATCRSSRLSIVPIQGGSSTYVTTTGINLHSVAKMSSVAGTSFAHHD